MNELVKRIQNRRDQHVKSINILESDPTPENMKGAEIRRQIKYELDDLLAFYYASHPDPSRDPRKTVNPDRASF